MSVIPKRRALQRLAGALAAAAIVAVCTTACGSGGAVRAALSSGVEQAQASWTTLVDDLADTATASAFRLPPVLDDAIKQADDLIRNGTRLTPEEEALLAASAKWAAFRKAFDAAAAVAADLEISLPDDAMQVVNASMRRDPPLEFRAAVVEIEEKLLKNMTCEAARNGLDALGEEQAQNVTPGYEPMVLTRDAVERKIEAELNLWHGAFDYVDYLALVSKTIDKHNERIDGVFTVLESPSGSLRTANLIWFRNCVLR